MSYAGPSSRAKRTADVAATSSPARGAAGAAASREPQRPTEAAQRAALRAANRSRTGAALFSTAVGVIVGAGLALLLAPQAGADTRRQLVRSTRRVSRRSRDAWDDLRDEFRHVVRRRQTATRRKRASTDATRGERHD